MTPRTIEHLKKRFVEEGLGAALERKLPDKPPNEVTFDEAFEARLIALTCSESPEGRWRWTVRLLAEKAVELNLAPRISHMTVQRILKKTNLSLTSGGLPNKSNSTIRPSTAVSSTRRRLN